jgi:hypothetical protein
MKNLFQRIVNGDRMFIVSLLISLLILFVRFRLDGLVLSDSFHHGEYFASLTTLLYGDFYPIMIHGALDYLPGFLSLTIFGEGDYFFHTWIFYKILDVLSVFIFLKIIYMFTKSKNKSTFILIGSAIIAPFVLGGRDVFLLMSIYLFFLIQRECRNNIRLFYEFIFGLTVFFGIFWTFDKGIVIVTSLGLSSMIYAYRNRIYIASLAVFFIALLSFHYFLPKLFSLFNYYENIKLLINTSYQWSYEFNRLTIFLTIAIATYVLLLLWLFIQSIVNSQKPREHIESSVLFVLLSLLVLKIAINRVDLGHVLFAIWPPILALSYLYHKQIKFHINIYLKYSFNVFLFVISLYVVVLIYQYNIFFIPFGVAAVGIIYLNYPKIRLLFESKILPLTYIMIMIILLLFMYKGSKHNQYDWVFNISSPQSNFTSVTDGVRWASEEIINSKANCIFDLSNNGVINGLTQLPSCSRFSYIVYADYRHEQEIIDSLVNSLPPVIVYSSTFWSFNLDGKSMHDRFPKLNDFILSKYIDEKCKYGYCIRYLEKDNELENLHNNRFNKERIH